LKRILAIKLKPVGDAILAGVCFEALREKFPQARITALVEPQAYELYRRSGWVDETMAFHSGAVERRSFLVRAWKTGKLVGALKKRHFDLALDFSGTPQSAQLAFDSQAVLKAGLGLPALRGFYDLNAKAGDASSAPLAELDRRVLNLIGLEPKPLDRPQGYWPVPGEALQFADTFWKANRFEKGQPVVAVLPFAFRKTRQWYPAQWAEVLNEMSSNGLKFFFTCPPWGKKGLEEMEKELGRKTPAYAGTEWMPLAGLYKRSTVVLGVDGDARYLAAAVGTPTLTLWGPDPVNRRHPYPPERHPVVMKEVPCRPCGLSVCVEKRHECMAMLKPEEVLKALKQLLKRALTV
jgi:ADP-heptose:LPS heptosyltransferase